MSQFVYSGTRTEKVRVAEVTAKRLGELQRGVFAVLLDHPEGLAAKDAIERTKPVVHPTDFEKSAYPKKPGIERFNKMVRFATIAPRESRVDDQRKGEVVPDRRRASGI